MADKRNERHTGIIKWLDTEGIGYITCENIEVLITPFSLSSKAINNDIKQGDKVTFMLKTHDSIPKYEAFDVKRFGVVCYKCFRSGHYSYDCPEKVGDYFHVYCFKCGLFGHYTNKCLHKVNYGADDDCGGGSVVGSSLDWPSLNDCWDNDNDNDDGDGGGGDDDDEEEEGEEEEVRYIVCVKKEEDVKKVEEVEDCFILEFDPSELDKLENLSLCDNSKVVDDNDEDNDELCILGEKGKVACRDYPHPRHLCATNLFRNTPHESHCKMCYCYICDIPAPCKKWSNVSKEFCFNHCDASDDSSYWRFERELEKTKTNVSQRPTP